MELDTLSSTLDFTFSQSGANVRMRITAFSAIKMCETSVKIILLSEWQCTMRKIVETRSSLSNTMKDTSTIMHNPSLHNSDKGVMHDCASIAKGTSCFHYFSHGISLVVGYIAIHSFLDLYIYIYAYAPYTILFCLKWCRA